MRLVENIGTFQSSKVKICGDVERLLYLRLHIWAFGRSMWMKLQVEDGDVANFNH